MVQEITGKEYKLKVTSSLESDNFEMQIWMNGEEALGYMMLACKEVGLPINLVKQLYESMLTQYDFYSAAEANQKGLEWFRAVQK